MSSEFGANLKLMVSAGPFGHSGRRYSRYMRDILLAMLPACVVAVKYWGIEAMRVMALAVSVAIVTEALAYIVMRRDIKVDDGNALIIGLGLAFLLPAASPWWLVVIGVMVTVLLGKMIFGGVGNSPVNAVAVGWAVLVVSWPIYMSSDAMQLNTELVDPLTRLKYFGVASIADLSFDKLGFGEQIAALGINSAYTIMLGGCFLLFRKVISWQIPFAFLFGAYALGAFYHYLDPSLYPSGFFYLITGSTMFVAFFLATDYSCSPLLPIPMLIYGLLGGFLTVLIRVYGVWLDGAPFAVLLINLLTPYLDKIRPKPFGAK